MKISVSKKILDMTPNFQIGVLIGNVKVYEEPEITKMIQKLQDKIYSEIDIKEVVHLDIIKDGRNAYKKYGKDPSRYRLATESLYRRLAKGNSLYRINNVVDLGNVLSINTRKSVAVLDYNKIKGDVHIRLGESSDEYYGIGRGKINIENIPLYEDDLGPFGSVTSDTERTMITNATRKMLLFIISFNNITSLEDELLYAKSLYEDYANGEDFSMEIL